MEEIILRDLAPQDVPCLYEICLKTGAAGADASADFSDPCLLGHYYAAPYAFFSETLGYVAELGGTPLGYLVCAPDTVFFRAWMELVWLPPLRRRYPSAENARSPFEARIIAALHKNHREMPPPPDGFPAHLHIDLLPAIQGRGCGKALMECLFTALAEQHVEGVHLGVSKKNPGAIAFYDKMGFSVLAEDESGQTRVKTLK